MSNVERDPVDVDFESGWEEWTGARRRIEWMELWEGEEGVEAEVMAENRVGEGEIDETPVYTDPPIPQQELAAVQPFTPLPQGVQKLGRREIPFDTREAMNGSLPANFTYSKVPKNPIPPSLLQRAVVTVELSDIGEQYAPHGAAALVAITEISSLPRQIESYFSKETSYAAFVERLHAINNLIGVVGDHARQLNRCVLLKFPPLSFRKAHVLSELVSSHSVHPKVYQSGSKWVLWGEFTGSEAPATAEDVLNGLKRADSYARKNR